MKIVQIIHESCGYVYLCAADGKASWKVVCVYLSLSIPMMQNHSRFYFLFFAIKKNRSSRTAMLLQIIVILIFT